MRKFGFIFLICLVWACSNTKDFVLKEKDLIPEGTAFNEETNSVYIGSIYKQKILGIEPDGTEADAITSDNFGQFSPLGMEMDNQTHTLWVCAAVAPIVEHAPDVKRQTAVLAFDPNENRQMKKFVLDTEVPAMLNDLTVDHKGNVYATETLGHKIYWIENGKNELELFLNLNKYHHPNGIVFYEAESCLFIATDEGIVKLNLETKELVLLATQYGIDATVIDGLAIYENFFIGHQSSKISKFYFNEGISKIVGAETLDSGDAFDSSTTGEIGNGHYYYIVNSQLKSGINRAEQKVKPLDSLEHVIIRKMKL
ncbi:hypothetical protein [Reichenbachiella sp.]|uniref:hypothetical protein n=1 Tax=Reichenbachiella sp. TaxID=2184521 RepID=UPI003BB16DFA